MARRMRSVALAASCLRAMCGLATTKSNSARIGILEIEPAVGQDVHLAAGQEGDAFQFDRRRGGFRRRV